MATSYSSRGAAPGATFPLRTAPIPAVADAEPMALPDGPGAEIDSRISDLDSRVSALEAAEAAEAGGFG